MKTKILKIIISVIFAINMVICFNTCCIGAITISQEASQECVNSVAKLNVNVSKLKIELNKFIRIKSNDYDNPIKEHVLCVAGECEKLLENSICRLETVKISTDNCNNKLLKRLKEMDCLIDNIVGDIRYFRRKLLDKKQELTCDDIKIFKLHNDMFNNCFCEVCWIDEQNNNMRNEVSEKFKEYHEIIENFEQWKILKNVKRKDDITKTIRNNVEDYYNKNKNNFDEKKAKEYIRLANKCIEEIEKFKCQYGDTKLINDKEILAQNIEKHNENNNEIKDIDFNGMDSFQSLDLDYDDEPNDNISNNKDVNIDWVQLYEYVDLEIKNIWKQIIELLLKDDVDLRLSQDNNDSSNQENRKKDIDFNGMDSFLSLNFSNDSYQDNNILNNKSIEIDWSQINQTEK